MIFLKVKDLLTFLFIAVIVMLSVGIYYYANLCPDDQNIWNGWGPVAVFWVIFLFPYWQLYGELSSSFIYGKLHFLDVTILITESERNLKSNQISNFYSSLFMCKNYLHF